MYGLKTLLFAAKELASGYKWMFVPSFRWYQMMSHAYPMAIDPSLSHQTKLSTFNSGQSMKPIPLPEFTCRIRPVLRWPGKSHITEEKCGEIQWNFKIAKLAKMIKNYNLSISNIIYIYIYIMIFLIKHWNHLDAMSLPNHSPKSSFSPDQSSAPNALRLVSESAGA